jgi:hypothetical protein
MNSNKTIYKAKLTGVSFVEYPATMQPALFFDSVRYEITSVVMYPNTPIDRGNYNVVFNSDAISTLQRQLLSGVDKLTLHHDNESVVGTNMELIEVFVVTPDKHNGVYEQYPVGTLMATYRCFDKKLYAQLKDKGFGISIEIDDIQTYKQLINKNQNVKMSKENKESRFTKAFKFEKSYPLEGENEPILIVDEEGNAFVATIGADGNDIIEPAADGEYKPLDGEVITVKDGKVVEPDKPQDPDEQLAKINQYLIRFGKTPIDKRTTN